MYSDIVKILDKGVDPDWVSNPIKCDWCDKKYYYADSKKVAGICVRVKLDNKFCPMCGVKL